MSERKVLNKYYPPDFDVNKLPKMRMSKDRQFVIRIMAPMSMRCNNCGEYIYKGKKFNARQETVRNEDYLGLRIYRFYIKCPCCVSEITFKTDPENTDYAMEHGATRSFQALRMAEKEAEKQRAQEEEDEKTNPMQALEKRTRESRMEMEIMEKLEEIKELNRRQQNVDYDMLIKKHIVDRQKLEVLQDAEDERLIKEIYYTKKSESEDEEEKIPVKDHLFKAGSHGVGKVKKELSKFGIIKRKPDSKPQTDIGASSEAKPRPALLVDYGSSSDSEK